MANPTSTLHPSSEPSQNKKEEPESESDEDDEDKVIEKFLHPAHVPYGGSFLEVKNPKNLNPKVVFHPNIFFKSHQFLVITLIEVSRGPIVCREECI